jgi:hypothetical protein
MKFLLGLIICLCFSVAAFAGNNLAPLEEKDLSILDSGAGCWLENSKSEQFIYDDMNHAAIKLGSKVLKLTRKSRDWDGFYSCGKNYEYLSEDQKITVSVKMKPGKADKCIGDMTVFGTFGKVSLKSLKSNCGE